MDVAFTMFAIGGNVSVPKYRNAKYELLEPLEAFIDSSNEVSCSKIVLRGFDSVYRPDGG